MQNQTNRKKQNTQQGKYSPQEKKQISPVEKENSGG